MSTPINFELKASDQASGPMQALIAVMRQGSQATADQITEFKEARASTSLQTRAMNELVGEYRAANPVMTMFGRAMSSVGAIGSTLMSITNTMMLANINQAVSTVSVANAQQQLTIATQTYYAAVQEFGPTDARTLRAKQDMIAAENNLKIATAQNRLVQEQTIMAYAGVALSIGGVASQVVTAIGNFSAFTSVLQDSSLVTKAAAAAQYILDAAMDANPIVLVGIAIAGVVAILYKVTDGFRNWTAVINFFKGIWNALPGPVKAVMDEIYNGFVAFWHDMTSAAQTLGSVLSAVFQDIFKGIVGFINMFIAGIDDVIKGLNAVASTLHLPTLQLIQQIAMTTTNPSTGGASAALAAVDAAQEQQDVNQYLGASAKYGAGSQQALDALQALQVAQQSATASGAVNITVNVQGNLMTQQQLVQWIDQQMQQRYSLRRRTA